MHLTLHGNTEYKLTRDEILNGYRGDNKNITVTIYGIERTVKEEWLYNLIVYGCKILRGDKSKIYDFRFDKVNNGYETQGFKESSYVRIYDNNVFEHEGKVYKIVPRYSDVAVTDTGDILHLNNNKSIPFTHRNAGYSTRRISTEPMVFLNTLTKNPNILVHRMVANTWCVNYDPANKTVVNHIDGVINNPHHTNLEWVTTKENLHHAYETGLNSKLGVNDRLISKIRDIRTGEVIKLTSKLRLVEKLNRTTPPSFGWELPLGATINGYEIRVYGDDREWVTDKRFRFKLNQRVYDGKIFTLHINTGELITFASSEEVCDYLKIPYTYPRTADSNKFLLWVVRKRRDVVIGAYRNDTITDRVRNPLAIKKNKSTITYDSIWYMIEDLNVTIEEAYKLLETEYTWFCNKRLKKEITGVACSYLDVPKELIDRKRKISVRIKAPRADKVYEFDNLNDSFKFVSKSGKDRSEKVLRGYPIGMLHCGYEYRLEGDDRPWMDEVNVWNFAKGSKCNYKVTFSDGTFMIYGNINTLVEIFDLKRARPEGQVNEFKQNHPDKKLEVLEK